jgi:uracil-DNA glycosylase
MTDKETDWRPILQAETEKPYWRTLIEFVNTERSSTKIFPKSEDVFSALHLTPYSDVRVVILGQDPYHNDGQAMGLSFSVPDGVKITTKS